MNALVICLNLSLGGLSFSPINIFTDKESTVALLSVGLGDWLFPLLLIPFYQLIVHRCVHGYHLSMLQCIGTGLFVHIVGFLLLITSAVYGVIVSDDAQRYLSCTALAANATHPLQIVMWSGTGNLVLVSSMVLDNWRHYILSSSS